MLGYRLGGYVFRGMFFVFVSKASGKIAVNLIKIECLFKQDLVAEECLSNYPGDELGSSLILIFIVIIYA